MNSATILINEGESAVALCVHDNVTELQVSGAWFNPHGRLIRTEVPFSLRFANILRSLAGEYVCVLTSELTGQTASSNLRVVVQCKLAHALCTPTACHLAQNGGEQCPSYNLAIMHQILHSMTYNYSKMTKNA